MGDASRASKRIMRSLGQLVGQSFIEKSSLVSFTARTGASRASPTTATETSPIRRIRACLLRSGSDRRWDHCRLPARPDPCSADWPKADQQGACQPTIHQGGGHLLRQPCQSRCRSSFPAVLTQPPHLFKRRRLDRRDADDPTGGLDDRPAALRYQCTTLYRFLAKSIADFGSIGQTG